METKIESLEIVELLKQHPHDYEQRIPFYQIRGVDGIFATTPTRQKAEFIIRAVNSHYSMLAALQLIQDLCLDPHAEQQSASDLHSDISRILNIAEKAIAKAEEKL